MRLVLISQFLLCMTFVSGNTLDTLREACPFTSFCTVNNSSTQRISDGFMPCCYDCFCDEYCSLLGDCCPDIEQYINKFNRSKLECRPVGSVPEAYSFLATDLPRYRVIDFCPPEYVGSTLVIERCEFEKNVSKVADTVLVSDQHGRTFKNVFCASCHGVQNGIRWDPAVLLCLGNLASMQLSLTEVQGYLLENCVLTSTRPRDVPVSSRTLQCIDAVCSGDIQDTRLRDGCIDGPYMPYIEVANSLSLSFILYKNIFCFKCTNKAEARELCPIIDNSSLKLTTLTFQLLLNMDILKMESSSSRLDDCAESGVMDRNTGTCKKVFCPPFQVVSRDQYISLSDDISDFFIATPILYTFDDDSTKPIIMQAEQYNNSLIQYYLKRVSSVYGPQNCKTFRISASLHSDTNTRKFLRLILKIAFKVTPKCSLQYIAEQVQKKTKFVEKERWFVGGKMVELGGRLTFHEDILLFSDPGYMEYQLINAATGPMKFLPLKLFFLCPYVKLNQTEYLELTKRLGKTRQETNLSYFGPMSRYLDGFYPLSRNEVAVCLQTYININGQVIIVSNCTVLAVSLLIVNMFYGLTT